jgi:hypothetical protein
LEHLGIYECVTRPSASCSDRVVDAAIPTIRHDNPTKKGSTPGLFGIACNNKPAVHGMTTALAPPDDDDPFKHHETTIRSGAQPSTAAKGSFSFDSATFRLRLNSFANQTIILALTFFFECSGCERRQGGIITQGVRTLDLRSLPHEPTRGNPEQGVCERLQDCLRGVLHSARLAESELGRSQRFRDNSALRST